MANREIGRTSIEVFPIGLGAMPVASPQEEDRAVQVIHAALDAGINFIDTCDVNCLDEYGLDHNEKLVRRALELAHSQNFVAVATKAGLKRPTGDSPPDASPEQLRKACEFKLRNLNSSSLFLYQLHVPEDPRALEENLREVARMKAEGMILHVGLFNASLAQYEAAQRIVRIETVQNQLNPFKQDDLRSGFVSRLRDDQVTYLAYAPMGGTYGHQALRQDPLFSELSSRYEISPYSLALCWLLSKGETILPIPGATKVENVRENVLAPQLVVDAADLARIDRVRQA